MDLFLEPLPDFITVDGTKFPINTCFRNWIKIEGILNSEYAIDEKIARILTLCYIRLPKKVDDAIYSLMDFYAGSNGETDSNSPQTKSGKKQKQIYSFTHDAMYIYGAFYAEYGIDLSSVSLHWWQFKALFFSLSENTRISKIMSYRACDLSAIKDKNQKSFYKKMKSIYKLPDNRSESQKECEMLGALSHFF